jgi:predicted cupin superfamily sugar epimerase
MEQRPLSPEHYTAEEIVRLLKLETIDREGGFFRRTAESRVTLPGLDRRAYSAIYSLITPEGFSALHRLAQDEVWCFHAGDSLESLQLRPDGSGGWMRLGLDVTAGEQPQMAVPAHTWQGTRLRPGGRWALSSCVVAPEFAWKDFELGQREHLATAYPVFAAGILALTRPEPPVGAK